MKREDFDIYAGCNLNIEELELLMLKNVKSELLVRERDLMDGRWFDYRGMHPTSATLLFNHTFYVELQKAFRKYVDVNKVYDGTIREGLFSRSKNLISQMWSARQTADRFCCPYDIFISAGIYEAKSQGWKHPPAPGQLICSELLTATCEYWSDYQKSAMPQPVRKDLLGVGAKDTIWKRQYQLWLSAEIESRPGPTKVILGSAIKMSQLLEEDIAREYFGDELVDSALRCFNFADVN